MATATEEATNSSTVIREAEANIRTASVEIKCLTVSNRQMTISVFKQIPSKRIFQVDYSGFDGEPWGYINHHSSDCVTSRHWHVVFVSAGEMFKDCVCVIDPFEDERYKVKQLEGAVQSIAVLSVYKWHLDNNEILSRQSEAKCPLLFKEGPAGNEWCIKISGHLVRVPLTTELYLYPDESVEPRNGVFSLWRDLGDRTWSADTSFDAWFVEKNRELAGARASLVAAQRNRAGLIHRISNLDQLYIAI